MTKPGILRVAVSVEPPVPSQEAPGGEIATREEWTPEHARRRLLAVILAEGARCPKARWPELAQVVRELAAHVEAAVAEPVPQALHAPESPEG